MCNWSNGQEEHSFDRNFILLHYRKWRSRICLKKEIFSLWKKNLNHHFSKNSFCHTTPKHFKWIIVVAIPSLLFTEDSSMLKLVVFGSPSTLSVVKKLLALKINTVFLSWNFDISTWVSSNPEWKVQKTNCIHLLSCGIAYLNYFIDPFVYVWSSRNEAVGLNICHHGCITTDNEYQ